MGHIESSKRALKSWSNGTAFWLLAQYSITYSIAEANLARVLTATRQTPNKVRLECVDYASMEHGRRHDTLAVATWYLLSANC